MILRRVNFMYLAIGMLSSLAASAPAGARGNFNPVPKQAPSASKPEEIPDITLGSQKAAVTLVEYSSVNCPHCAKFHNGPFKDFKRKYIDTGKLFYVYRHFPLDYNAVECMALIAQQPKTQWLPLIEKAYANIEKWIRGDLQALAKVINLPGAEVEKAKKNKNLRRKVIAKRYNAESQYTIDITPSYLLVVRDARGGIRTELINTYISATDLEKKIRAHMN